MINIFLLKKKGFTGKEIEKAIEQAESIEYQARELAKILCDFTDKLFDYADRYELNRVTTMKHACSIMCNGVREVFTDETKS